MRRSRSKKEFAFLFFLTLLLSVEALDVINTAQTIRDGETLVSSGGNFELGFFSPGTSKNRYVGIWYKKITAFTVIWVANRDNPITNTSGSELRVIEPGMLTLMNGSNGIVWSSNTSRVARAPVAQLLDSGNLVLKEANDDNSENYLWQSFDNPTDTLLPGMKFGHLASGHENYLSSWKTNEDPGTGKYTYRLDPTGYPQGIFRRGSVELYRTGPWNGEGYSGVPGLQINSIFKYEFTFNDKEIYYNYELLNNSVLTRLVTNLSGVSQRWTWIDQTKGWQLYLTTPIDNCDSYGLCGPNSNCNVENFPNCGCLKNFVPRNPGDYSNGCARRVPLDCRSDGFIRYSQIKLPDTKDSRFNVSMSLAECRVVCLQNCSCTAYSNLDIRNGGSGCLLWFGDLVDIKQVYGAGQDIYIRVAASELESTKKRNEILIVSLTSLAGVILLSSFIWYVCKKKNIYQKLRKGGQQKESNDRNLELPFFHLPEISKATNNFSSSNKLGEGGFGPVYKGTLEDGQEIAVKRLSKTSLQGVDEFKNEVICIARLQHRNLVKLLGCCIGGEEIMLIYEYMPNKSLDMILFDETKSKLLDWSTCFHIISGIARGLMYLHQDSRLRIIHRDLKVGNILLDMDMNPKISDFGLARSFGGNETEANTRRIVGTYGYMSPEYATDGLFSVKSDVFSFGVVLLEIVSGKRNRGFSHRDHHHNLLGHVWLLYKEGRSLELVKDTVVKSSYLSEVLRSIHVGLLCVQAHPEDRPSMSSVVNMLENEVKLPQAKQPGFFTQRDVLVTDISSSTRASTTNEFTITMPEPR